MKQKLTILSTLLLWLFVVSSCQEDTHENVFPDFESSESIVTLQTVPGLVEVFNNFPGNTGINTRGESTAFDEETQFATMDFGKLDLTAITQIISEADQPNPNYTIRLYPPHEVDNALEYLVLIGAEGGYVAQIHQYQTNDENQWTLADRDHFTGTYRVMDLARNVFSEVSYAGGIELIPEDNGRNDLNIILPFGCQCTTQTVNHGPTTLSNEDQIEIVSIHCDCSGGGNSNGNGGSLPGRPGNFVSGEDGFSGGSTGTGTPSGDVLPPNPNGKDDIIIIPRIPKYLAEIYADREFMDDLEEALECAPKHGDPVVDEDNLNPKVTQYLYEVAKVFGKRVLNALVKEQYFLIISDDPEEAVQIFQDGLDVVGLYPGLGEVADAGNFLIYSARGDELNASLSGISIIPFLGDGVGKGLRYTIRVIETTPGGKQVIKALRELDTSQFEKLIDAITSIPTEKLTRFFDDLVAQPSLFGKFIRNPRLINIWRKFSTHEIRLNEAFLEKVSKRLSQDQDKLADLYKNLKAPAGFKGKVNFTATKTINGKSVSVKYDEFGFPDFTSSDFTLGKNFSILDNSLDGSLRDFDIANNFLENKFGKANIRVLNDSGTPVLIKINGKFEGPFTWHHHQDGKTMMPVLQSVHNAFSHSGGRAFLNRNLKGFIDSPY